ncbi:unnamed protein product [Didymodactylos carnosus]|uniref:Uncharacterized protein n=1 Tax=Didymodactylos carnosus TaxID=1234261 RepID=A0A8S2IQB6_9BILA|nr:unnamed protein product [Didymodactylos carnosus]CAF3751433.1 unnamed protein product [Didymodactylos carnosus]
MHKSGPFFSLNQKEFEETLKHYPDLDSGTFLNYATNSASATINIGEDKYFDNRTILSQFERTFQLLPFKEDYKNHDFVFLVDNARPHTATEYSIHDFAMNPGYRCRVETIEYVDEQNVKRTLECYDPDDGEGEGDS